MRADGKNTKQVATSLKLSELSGVTVPAHTGANVTLFKCADPKELFVELAKSAFNDVLIREQNEKQSRDELQPVMDALCQADCALWTANRDAMENGDTDQVRQNIVAYATSLLTMQKAKDVSEILGMAIDDAKKDEVEDMLSDPLNGDTLEERIKTVRSKLKKSGESDMTDKEIELLKSQLAEAVALGSMNDVQKAHYETIKDETEKSAFAKMSASDRDATVEILKQADETYVMTDGVTLAKSQTPNFDLIKSQDMRLAKMEKEQRAEVFVKAAQSDASKHLPGADIAKAAALEYIDAAPAEVKKTISEMLSAGNAALGQEFTVKASIGGENHAATTSLQKFNSLVANYQTEHKCNKSTAMQAVVKTAEGSRLADESRGEN